MKMPDPELLRVLITFSESKNLVEAAQRLQISQPAVTQRLQRRQEQVPAKLYDFAGRKKILTPYGQGLYELSKTHWQQLAHGFESLNRRHASAAQLVLRLGGKPELFRFFTDLIHFEGKIEFQQLQEAQVLAALKEEKIDVGLTSSHAVSVDLESRKIFESSSRLIFNKKNLPSVETFRDLQKRPDQILELELVAHRFERGMMEAVSKALHVKPAQVKTKALLDDWSSILSFLEGGDSFAIVPGFVQIQQRNLKTIEIPHAVLARESCYAVFSKKLRRVEAFKKLLSFPVWSS
jgi:DNA-binding transcriptional LysR family regulator